MDFRLLFFMGQLSEEAYLIYLFLFHHFHIEGSLSENEVWCSLIWYMKSIQKKVDDEKIHDYRTGCNLDILECQFVELHAECYVSICVLRILFSFYLPASCKWELQRYVQKVILFSSYFQKMVCHVIYLSK